MPVVVRRGLLAWRFTSGAQVRELAGDEETEREGRKEARSKKPEIEDGVRRGVSDGRAEAELVAQTLAS